MSRSEPGGLVARVRIERSHARRLLRVLRPGEIAVLNAPDLDTRLARSLIDREVGAVVNTSSFMTGRFPNLGPRLLADAGIPMLEVQDVTGLVDGRRYRLEGGTLSTPEGQEAVSGRLLTAAEVSQALGRARAEMSRHLQDVSATSTGLMEEEHALLLQGTGLPPLRVPSEGRSALVVVQGALLEQDLRSLRSYVAEARPVVFAVDQAVHDLIRHRIKPDVVVASGDRVTGEGPESISPQDLLHVQELVVHHSRAEGAQAHERLDRWGVPAHVVISDVATRDIALLLAQAGGADLIVTAGGRTTLEDFADRDQRDQASALLTRLRLQGRAVAAPVVADLYAGRVRAWHLWLIVLVSLLALWLAMATTPIGNVWFHAVNHWISHLFSGLGGAR